MKAKRRGTRSRVRETSPAYEVNPVRLLLDTHSWIWWKASHPGLGTSARVAIRSAAQVYVSVASVWEMAIKSTLGKLTVPPNVDYANEIASDGFLQLTIELRHAAGVATLPRIHADPFDRLLVSQAIAEGLTIVSADAAIARYSVSVIDAHS